MRENAIRGLKYIEEGNYSMRELLGAMHDFIVFFDGFIYAKLHFKHFIQLAKMQFSLSC